VRAAAFVSAREGRERKRERERVGGERERGEGGWEALYCRRLTSNCGHRAVDRAV
jgi:hypothetical protein